ncbi:hypothetical protein PAMP_003882 [Pampus punctatissimus]
MKHSTLTCVDQHLGFTVLIVYSPSKGLGRDIYYKNVPWVDPPCSRLLQSSDNRSLEEEEEEEEEEEDEFTFTELAGSVILGVSRELS